MSQGWHREDIIAAVRKRGTTLMELARHHGFASGSFYSALTRRFPNVHLIIAREIGETRHALWPHWYDAQDRPKFRTRRDLARTAQKLQSNELKEAA